MSTRQIANFVRYTGNGEFWTEEGRLSATAGSCYKTTVAVPALAVSPALLVSPRVRYGFGPRAVAPGADNAKKCKERG